MVPRPLDRRGRNSRSSRRKHDCPQRRVLVNPVVRVDWSIGWSCAPENESEAWPALRTGKDKRVRGARAGDTRRVKAAQTVTSWRHCSTPNEEAEFEARDRTGGRITRPGKDENLTPAQDRGRYRRKRPRPVAAADGLPSASSALFGQPRAHWLTFYIANHVGT